MAWLAFLKPVGSFIGSNWKIIGGVLGALFLYWKLGNMWEDYSEWKDQQEQTITQLTAERDAAIIEAESTKAALEEKEKHDQKVEALRQDLLANRDEIIEKVRREIKAFEGHDLEKMALEHEDWMRKIINKGTQEKLDAIEDTVNQ